MIEALLAFKKYLVVLTGYVEELGGGVVPLGTASPSPESELRREDQLWRFLSLEAINKQW